MTEASESPRRSRLSPFLAQRRCDLINQGASLDSAEVRQLNEQLREHDAACELLIVEIRAGRKVEQS